MCHEVFPEEKLRTLDPPVSGRVRGNHRFHSEPVNAEAQRARVLSGFIISIGFPEKRFREICIKKEAGRMSPCSKLRGIRLTANNQEGHEFFR
jgi:hypothetical protein